MQFLSVYFALFYCLVKANLNGNWNNSKLIPAARISYKELLTRATPRVTFPLSLSSLSIYISEKRLNSPKRGSASNSHPWIQWKLLFMWQKHKIFKWNWCKSKKFSSAHFLKRFIFALKSVNKTWKENSITVAYVSDN